MTGRINAAASSRNPDGGSRAGQHIACSTRGPASAIAARQAKINQRHGDGCLFVRVWHNTRAGRVREMQSQEGGSRGKVLLSPRWLATLVQ